MSRPRIPRRFLGAFKAGHHAAAKEFIDEELSYKLLKRIIDSNYEDLEALKALTYLTKFNNEYHKAVIKKGDLKALHFEEPMRKERYGANNAKNRDIMSKLRFLVESITPTPVQTTEGPKLKHLKMEAGRCHEDIMTALIDLKNKHLRLTLQFR